ncbi:MAG: hypothetical protein WCI51_18415 [Lentisphaerota bacterium]
MNYDWRKGRNSALEFATEWIAAWNSHDLNRVLSHYSEDFETSSPFIAKMCKIVRQTKRQEQCWRILAEVAGENA